jgi:hypothetical protein
MKYLAWLLLCAVLCSCSSTAHTLKYGFLPGSDYQYYEPLHPVDLKGQKYHVVVYDRRNTDRMSCYDHTVPRDTELEGDTGYEFFKNYLAAMIKANNGVVDENAARTIEVKLTVLSGELRGFVNGHVWGLVEFDAVVGDSVKTYCAAMVDGDEDAPVGKYSVDTRKGAFRKLVSGATRKAFEELMHDLATETGSK